MKIWIFSLSGALTLSFIHFALELWRAFMDFWFILPEFSDGSTGSVVLFGFVYTLGFAIWLLGWGNALRGKRIGIITAIVIGALFWVVIDLGTILFICPGGCTEVIFDIASYTGLIFGGMALFGLAANLRQAARRPS